MRYIKKDEEPAYMQQWKVLRQGAGQILSYADFDRKELLNDALRKEQRHICCYCQQALTHFQGAKTGGAHNEHLVPQKGGNGNPSLQMDYGNIYACCIDSRGMSEDHRHCGESKGDKQIRAFIQGGDCISHFQYNILGEIIPNGPHARWIDYLREEATLTGDVRDAYMAIKRLNLNCHALVTARKGDLDALIKWMGEVPQEVVVAKMATYEQSEHYLRFLDMLLFYMRRKKKG